MYVSNKKFKTFPILNYNHKALQLGDSFKHQGINVSRTGKLTEGLQNVCQKPDRALGCGRNPDFDVNFAYLNFRLKGFPVSDFQHGDGYTESHRLM